MRLYSNLPEATVGLAQLRLNAVSQPRRRPDRTLVPQRVDRRLGPLMIERIMTEYVRGASSTRLATRYGVGKGTLLRLLREHGVVVRRHGGWRPLGGERVQAAGSWQLI